MELRAIVVVCASALAGAGCGSPAGREATSETWVGRITTDNGVTTIVNESGSVWGGTARLVEEASIGVESGAEQYLFGSVSFLYATDDRIYIVDDQAGAVRAYDHAGGFVQAYGRAGQGPGEYGYPGAVIADDSGRVFVQDNRNARINVYAGDGAVLDSWPKPVSICCWPMYPMQGDAVWASVFVDAPAGVRRGAQAFGPDGALGEPVWLPEIEYQEASYEYPGGGEGLTPFSPYLVWTLAPGGKLLAGASDRYRFARYGARGAEMVVERAWQPVPVEPEHIEWTRRLEIASQRDLNGADVSLSLTQIPHHQPAFAHLAPALSGETWVVRAGESRRVADCAGDPLEVGYPAAWARPCWNSRRLVDVFAADGRYLGDVTVQEGVDVSATPPFIDGRLVIAVHQDDADTIRVKRYRLVLPGEE